MSERNEFTHLTLEERRVILTGIRNGSTKTAIAQTIGKDKSTVGKEIKLPKGNDLRALGLTDQAALNLAISHVDSAPVQKLGGKSPLEVTELLRLFKNISQLEYAQTLDIPQLLSYNNIVIIHCEFIRKGGRNNVRDR